MHTGVIHCITRTLGTEQEVILIIEEVMDIICEVIRDIEIITTITEGTVIEVKVITEIEVGH